MRQAARKRRSDTRQRQSLLEGLRETTGTRRVRSLRRHPVLYIVLALMLLLFASGMATGFNLAVKLNYVLGLLIVISFLWSKYGASQITAEVDRPHGPFSVGDTYSEEVTVRNRASAPRAWVEIEDETDIPGLSIRRVTGLGVLVPFSRISASGVLTRRGEFTVGPLRIRASDPFALFPQEIQFSGQERILVYPRVVPIPDFAAPSVHTVGDSSRRHRSNVLSTDVSSVRDYVAGDSVNRIHWPSTARTGHLMVKQFDLGSQSHVWVVFDQQRGTGAGQGAESTDEYGATIAASVIDRYSRSFLPVGYAAHGSASLVSMPDRSIAQREVIMRHIAASRPEGDVSLLELLADLEREFSQSSSLVAITSAGRADWIAGLLGLHKRGVRVSAVILDRASFGGPSNEDAVTDLAGAGIRTYRVRKGDHLPSALASPVGTGSAGYGPRSGRDGRVASPGAPR